MNLDLATSCMCVYCSRDELSVGVLRERKRRVAAEISAENGEQHSANNIQMFNSLAASH